MIKECEYCREHEGCIKFSRAVGTNGLKPTAGYRTPTKYRDYLELFIMKLKNDKKAGLMVENLNGTRYIDINYCPWCGRKL